MQKKMKRNSATKNNWGLQSFKLVTLIVLKLILWERIRILSQVINISLFVISITFQINEKKNISIIFEL